MEGNLRAEENVTASRHQKKGRSNREGNMGSAGGGGRERGLQFGMTVEGKVTAEGNDSLLLKNSGMMLPLEGPSLDNAGQQQQQKHDIGGWQPGRVYTSPKAEMQNTKQ
jgi:hypothetical protein